MTWFNNNREVKELKEKLAAAEVVPVELVASAATAHDALLKARNVITDHQRVNSEQRAHIAQLMATIAGLQRNIDELADENSKLSVDGLAWRALCERFVWNPNGSVEIDGEVFRVFTARRDNPRFNFRVPVPPSQEMKRA